jgi:NADH-quinone oxidoreductase subunit K
MFTSFIFVILETESNTIILLTNPNLFGSYSTENFSLYAQLLCFFSIIFFIGVAGFVFNRKNFFVSMLGVELIYLANIICFLLVSAFTNLASAQLYALIVLVVAATESALGLAILIVLYKFDGSIKFETYTELRG